MRKSGLPVRCPVDPHQRRPRSLYRVPGGPYRPAGDSSRDPLCSGGSGGAGKDPEGSGGVWQHGKVGRSSHAEKSKTLPQTEGPSFAEGPLVRDRSFVFCSSSAPDLRRLGGARRSGGRSPFVGDGNRKNRKAEPPVSFTFDPSSLPREPRVWPHRVERATSCAPPCGKGLRRRWLPGSHRELRWPKHRRNTRNIAPQKDSGESETVLAAPPRPPISTHPRCQTT